MSLGSDHTGSNERGTKPGTGSPSESEDAIRHLKASLSVEAAFQAAGFSSPPGDIAAIITNHVKSTVQGLPISQVANMSPGSGVLGTAATAAVDQFVSSLTPTQREAVKAGVNPLDASTMIKLGGMFQTDGVGPGRLASRDGTSTSGARYDSVGGSGTGPASGQAFWSTPTGIAQMRDLAVKSGISWATNNPELLRLGPSAIKILADVHLHKDSYERFKKGGLTPTAVVDGAHRAKQEGYDYNDASKAYDAVQQQLDPAGQQAHNQAVTDLNKSWNAPPEAKAKATKQFNERMDNLKQSNPGAARAIDDEKKVLHTVQQMDRAATATADQKAQMADKKVDVADKKDVAAKGKEVIAEDKAKNAATSHAALDDDFASYGTKPAKPLENKPPAAPVQRGSNDPSKGPEKPESKKMSSMATKAAGPSIG